jgi:hypothetical protein
MGDIICPGDNLDLLLVGLLFVDFNRIGSEPTMREATELARFSGKNVSPQQSFSIMLRSRQEEQKYLTHLLKYGSSREQIIGSLGKHVRGCRVCLPNYTSIIEEWAHEDLEGAKRGIINPPVNLSEETRLSVEELYRRISNKSMDELRREEDARLLNILYLP